MLKTPPSLSIASASLSLCLPSVVLVWLGLTVAVCVACDGGQRQAGGGGRHLHHARPGRHVRAAGHAGHLRTGLRSAAGGVCAAAGDAGRLQRPGGRHGAGRPAGRHAAHPLQVSSGQYRLTGQPVQPSSGRYRAHSSPIQSVVAHTGQRVAVTVFGSVSAANVSERILSDNASAVFG